MPFELGDFLPYQLSVLANQVSSNLARAYAERFDLSISEWRVMATLGGRDGLSAEAVCRCTAMDKVTVSRAVARLRRSGRLRREVARDDRRRHALSLTPAGRRVYEEIVPMAVAYEQQLLAGLEPAQCQVLDGLLGALRERAEALAEAPVPTPSAVANEA